MRNINNLIRAGLCSVTFRNLSSSQVIFACVENGLQTIEWGGDIHCPHGDTLVATSLRRSCKDAGIDIPSYGSYFRMDPECAQPDFRHVLDSALALGVSTIRVWAGRRSSLQMDESYRHRLVEEIRRIGSLAESAGCSIGIEYHRHTATDTNSHAMQLLAEVQHPAVKVYWQPRELTPVHERIEGLRMIRQWLCHLHVFNWVGTPVQRRPLGEAVGEWEQYLSEAIKEGLDQGICAYLEFVPGDSLDSLRVEAQSLKALLKRTIC